MLEPRPWSATAMATLRSTRPWHTWAGCGTLAGASTCWRWRRLVLASAHPARPGPGSGPQPGGRLRAETQGALDEVQSELYGRRRPSWPPGAQERDAIPGVAVAGGAAPAAQRSRRAGAGRRRLPRACKGAGYEPRMRLSWCKPLDHVTLA